MEDLFPAQQSTWLTDHAEQLDLMWFMGSLFDKCYVITLVLEKAAKVALNYILVHF